MTVLRLKKECAMTLVRELIISTEFYMSLDHPYLLKQMRGALEGTRGYPLFRVKSELFERNLFFTYAPLLQVKIMADPDPFKKFHEVAIHYG